MSYIGSTPTTQSFIAGTDYFNGDGSTVAFTLSRSVVSVNDIEVVINNVEQQPNTAYTVSGTTITFTSAPSAGTSNIYVRYLSTTTQSITPSQNTVSYSTLNSDNQSKLGISFKNRLINGAMTINQRGGYSGTPTPGVPSYSLDRWWVGVGSGSTAVTVAQTSTGGLTGFPNCVKVQRNSGQTNTSAIYFVQQIESVNMQDLQGQTVTVSFLGKAGANYSAASSNLTVYVTYGTGTDQASWNSLGGFTGFSLTTPISTAITTSFQKFTGTTIVPSNANEMSILFVFTPTGTAGADDSFSITGVQLEVGTQATTFDYRSYGTELALCQRYYFQITSNGTQYTAYAQGFAPTTTDVSMLFKYPVPPRTACTGITAAGTANWIVQQSTNLYNPTITFIRANQTNITVNAALTGATVGSGATLIDGNNASYIYFNGMEL